MPRRNRGFTMIELLLVLCVMSIFCSVGLSIEKGAQRIALMTTANNIQSLIRTAQTTAYGQQRVHIVSFSPDLGRCTHIHNSKSMGKVAIPKNIKLKKTNFPEDQLYFRRKLSPNRGGTIILSSKSYQVKITVLPVTGRVKVYPITRK